VGGWIEPTAQSSQTELGSRGPKPGAQASGSGTANVGDEGGPGTGSHSELRAPAAELRVSDVGGAAGSVMAGLAPGVGDFEAFAALVIAVAGLEPRQLRAHSSSATFLTNRADSITLSACMRIMPWRCVRALSLSASAYSAPVS
jgi:hypothetical protein